MTGYFFLNEIHSWIIRNRHYVFRNVESWGIESLGCKYLNKKERICGFPACTMGCRLQYMQCTNQRKMDKVFLAFLTSLLKTSCWPLEFLRSTHFLCFPVSKCWTTLNRVSAFKTFSHGIQFKTASSVDRIVPPNSKT